MWRNQNSHRVGYHINLVCIFISFYSIEKQPSELTASMMSPVNPSLSLSPLWTVSLSLSPSFNGMQNPPASGTWGQCSRFCLNDLEIELVFKTHLTSLQASISREGGHHLSFGSILKAMQRSQKKRKEKSKIQSRQKENQERIGPRKQ